MRCGTSTPARSRFALASLTGLATAQAQQGDVEQACRLAIQSLGIAAQTDTEPSLQDVYTLRQQLDQWNDTEPVRELDEALAAA